MRGRGSVDDPKASRFGDKADKVSAGTQTGGRQEVFEAR